MRPFGCLTSTCIECLPVVSSQLSVSSTVVNTAPWSAGTLTVFHSSVPTRRYWTTCAPAGSPSNEPWILKVNGHFDAVVRSKTMVAFPTRF